MRQSEQIDGNGFRGNRQRMPAKAAIYFPCLMETFMEAQTYNYKVVRQFAVMTVVWGVVGMLVGVIAAAQLFLPSLNPGMARHDHGGDDRDDDQGSWRR